MPHALVDVLAVLALLVMLAVAFVHPRARIELLVGLVAAAAGVASVGRDGGGAQDELRHISAYASAHPWEDWAETWAHYLHIQDTLETTSSFGLSLGR